MNLLEVASPALKLLFERVGRPEIANRPALLGPDGGGAVIVCNHVGWADSLWIAYAVYPRPLCYVSKQELFGSPLARWAMKQGGSIPINRANPTPSSIKNSVDLLRQGKILLIFPSGTRRRNNSEFKRGAATIALHAGVPIVPAFYLGPTEMHAVHLMHRPPVLVTFGLPIQTTGLSIEKNTASALTRRLELEINKLGSIADP